MTEQLREQMLDYLELALGMLQQRLDIYNKGNRNPKFVRDSKSIASHVIKHLSITSSLGKKLITYKEQIQPSKDEYIYHRILPKIEELLVTVKNMSPKLSYGRSNCPLCHKSF